MKTCLNHMRICGSIFSVLLLGACTTGSVEQAVAPQPIAAQVQTPQTTAADNTPNVTPTTETALVAQTPGTAEQNVAQAQIQQTVQSDQQQPTPDIQQTASIGLADGIVPTATKPVELASIDTKRALALLPVEGAPQTKLASLKKSLDQSAKAQGLTLLPTKRTGIKYEVKGYFSALNDGSGTLLVYIWDVVDSNGKRLHRINGREKTSTSRADPWQAITDKEIQRMANTSVARLKSWVDTKS